MDNTATIAFSMYQAENVRNRHIDLLYKFVKKLHEQKYFEISHVPTFHNLSYFLTKSLGKVLFYKFWASYLKELSSQKVNQELYRDTDNLLPLQNFPTT